MATPYPIPVTAAQVGTYFVRQYYQVLQKQPNYAYQFYSHSSTMLRIDGLTRETATTVIQIHELIMSLNCAGIEIRTANALDSGNGGVLVLVSGFMLLKRFSGTRKFVETFFLAPQDTGYFVLNDVFHFVDDEVVHLHTSLLPTANIDSRTIAAPTIPEPVPNFLLGGEDQNKEFEVPANAIPNGVAENYDFQEKPLPQVSEDLSNLKENSWDEPNISFQSPPNNVHDHLPASVEESVAEPQKHTYASIVVRGHPVTPVSSQQSVVKNALPTSEWVLTPQPATQQPIVTSSSCERSGAESIEDALALEDEDEIKSVYVRNLLPIVSEFEIEEEFKKFGILAPDGVVIRSRKDVGVCYAFVEFEDMAGVHNAVEAGTAIVGGRQVYIEERRPNSNIPYRLGRGRGRGRAGYPTDAARGRFVSSRTFGRGGGGGGTYDSMEREFNRTRGNGYYWPSLRSDRVVVQAHQLPRTGGRDQSD